MENFQDISKSLNFSKQDILLNEAKNEVNRYTMKYRIIKTILLIMAWVSFGLNNEIIGPTFEDVKILLNSNYQMVSFLLVSRSIGYIILVPFCGIVYDKFPKYAELIMSSSCFLLASANFVIPISKIYWLSVAFSFIQGLASAIHDLGGNHIILSLWKGISNSPINAMHSGYGFGALIAVQICKPFIKFDSIDKLKINDYSNLTENFSLNNTVRITSNDIILFKPYCFTSLFAIFLGVLFIISQIIESKNTKRFHKSQTNTKLALLKENNTKLQEDTNRLKNKNPILKLLFGDKVYRGKSLIYMITQITLITFILFCLQGYLTVISKFMLTYLTKGPGNFTVDQYSSIQTLFWLLFVISRFSAAFVAFKMNPILFVLSLLVLKVLTTQLFLIPYFCQFKLFYLIGLSLIGISNGPAHPSTFMLAKQLLGDYNSFVISIFSIGASLSSIVFQDITGTILDNIEPKEYFLGFNNFQPAYIITYVAFLPCFLCLIVCLISSIIYKKYFNQLESINK